MTYRELWEQRIHELPPEEFNRLMITGSLSSRYEYEQCRYCKEANGGTCPHRDDDGCMDDLIYLAAEVGA